MKLIVAGSRQITSKATIFKAIHAVHADHPITEIVSGACRGVDTIAEEWAASHNIPVKRFPADWNTHGKAAGPIRNHQMAEYADALLAIWDGQSHGTDNMIQQMKRMQKAVSVVTVDVPGIERVSGQK